MEFQKAINSLDITSDNKKKKKKKKKTSDNKDLLKHRSKFMINKKKNKEIEIERPIIVLSIKHNTIV